MQIIGNFQRKSQKDLASGYVGIDSNGKIHALDGSQLTGIGGGGTVTGVSSANADIGVSSPSPTPALTLNSGTGANQIVKLNGSAQLPAIDGSLLTNLSNVAYNNSWLTTLAKLDYDSAKACFDPDVAVTKLSNNFVDVFTDYTGFKDTVQIATTTATFKSTSNKYALDKNGSSLAHGETMTSGGGVAYRSGIKIYVNQSCNLNSVTVQLGDPTPATTVEIFDGNTTIGTHLAIATLVGSTATFSPAVNLVAGQSYHIAVYNGGSGFYPTYKLSGCSFPYNKAELNFVISFYDSSGTWEYRASGFASDIASLVINQSGTSPVIIDCLIPTFTPSATITKTLVVAEALDNEGDSSVKYNLVNGATSDNSLLRNQQNALTNITSALLSDGSCHLQIKLTEKSSSPTVGKPSCSGYVMLAFDANNNIISVINI